MLGCFHLYIRSDGAGWQVEFQGFFHIYGEDRRNAVFHITHGGFQRDPANRPQAQKTVSGSFSGISLKKGVSAGSCPKKAVIPGLPEGLPSLFRAVPGYGSAPDHVTGRCVFAAKESGVLVILSLS